MGCEWMAERAGENGIKIRPFGSKSRLFPKLISLLQTGFTGAEGHFPLYLQGFCRGRKGVFRACILYVRFKHVFSKACYDAPMNALRFLDVFCGFNGMEGMAPPERRPTTPDSVGRRSRGAGHI